MEALACPNCALPYKADDVHVAEKVVVCRACDAVHRLIPARPAHRPVASRPERWAMEEAGGGLVLRKRWFGWHAVLLLVFVVVWDFAALVAITTEGLGGVLHVLGGIVVTYITFANLLNTSTIEVRSGRLRATHGPVPWPGNVEMATGDIAQLYVELTGVRVNKQPRWQVLCVDREGVARRIGPLVASIEEGRWIEQRIEEHLRLPDRDMPGEAWGR